MILVDIDRLRRLANMAGAPTMSYAPEIERKEQRKTLNAIAAELAAILKDAAGQPPQPAQSLGHDPRFCSICQNRRKLQ